MRVLENGDGIGLFLRSGCLLYKDNVAWHHMANPYMLPMHYYEWDWYAENGGTKGFLRNGLVRYRDYAATPGGDKRSH